MAAPRVAVVGGGLAGLMTTIKLAEAGVQPIDVVLRQDRQTRLAHPGADRPRHLAGGARGRILVGFFVTTNDRQRAGNEAPARGAHQCWTRRITWFEESAM